jgi:broad specificity phosphatase PhoE
MVFSHLPQKIVYVRHPQCLHNVAHEEAMEQGIANKYSPLTAAGEQQCDITAQYLREHLPWFDAVFTSTFTRTQTIPARAKFAMTTNSLLDERSMGVWHTHTKTAVLERYPDEEKRLKEVGYYHYKAPEGESCVDVEERILTFLQHKPRFKGLDTVLISGHGITGLCLRRILFGDSVEDWQSYERLKNASVTVYERKGDGFNIALYNHAPWEGLIEAKAGSEA